MDWLIEWIEGIEWFKYMSWNDCAPIVLVGFAVVFLGLILLVAIFYLSGGIFQGIDKISQARAKKKSIKESSKEKAAPAKKVEATKASSPAFEVEDGINDEIIAVISAAVASMSDGDVKYAVKSVRKVQKSGRPIWAMAGIRENTSSF